MKAKIKNKVVVAKQTLLVEYDLLGKKINFKPGQYFHITLIDAPYKEDSKHPKHHFTILNSPNEKGIISHTTRIRDSAFKQSLKEMPLGSEVEIYGIGGDFILPPPVRPLVFIALGIGITPYISMLRYIKEENSDHRITLFYSDSDKESLAYLQELEMYEKENPNFKMIVTITGQPDGKGENRHIDGQFIQDYLQNPNENTFLISGPPKIVKAVASSLSELGIAKENIITDEFTGY